MQANKLTVPLYLASGMSAGRVPPSGCARKYWDLGQSLGVVAQDAVVRSQYNRM